MNAFNDKLGSLFLLSTRCASSWWVILFALFCYIAYEQSLISLQGDFQSLTLQLHALQEKKQQVSAEQLELKKQITHHLDPAWIELMLMQELGLTPENQTKVYFYLSNI